MAQGRHSVVFSNMEIDPHEADEDGDVKLEAAGETHGRWTAKEHSVFVAGIKAYGKDWKRIAATIPTRTVIQIRTHAQKYFQKLARSAPPGTLVSTSICPAGAQPRGRGSRASSPTQRHADESDGSGDDNCEFAGVLLGGSSHSSPARGASKSPGRVAYAQVTASSVARSSDRSKGGSQKSRRRGSSSAAAGLTTAVGDGKDLCALIELVSAAAAGRDAAESDFSDASESDVDRSDNFSSLDSGADGAAASLPSYYAMMEGLPMSPAALPAQHDPVVAADTSRQSLPTTVPLPLQHDPSHLSTVIGVEEHLSTVIGVEEHRSATVCGLQARAAYRPHSRSLGTPVLPRSLEIEPSGFDTHSLRSGSTSDVCAAAHDLIPPFSAVVLHSSERHLRLRLNRNGALPARSAAVAFFPAKTVTGDANFLQRKVRRSCSFDTGKPTGVAVGDGSAATGDSTASSWAPRSGEDNISLSCSSGYALSADLAYRSRPSSRARQLTASTIDYNCNGADSVADTSADFDTVGPSSSSGFDAVSDDESVVPRTIEPCRVADMLLPQPPLTGTRKASDTNYEAHEPEGVAFTAESVELGEQIHQFHHLHALPPLIHHGAATAVSTRSGLLKSDSAADIGLLVQPTGTDSNGPQGRFLAPLADAAMFGAHGSAGGGSVSHHHHHDAEMGMPLDATALTVPMAGAGAHNATRVSDVGLSHGSQHGATSSERRVRSHTVPALSSNLNVTAEAAPSGPTTVSSTIATASSAGIITRKRSFQAMAKAATPSSVTPTTAGPVTSLLEPAAVTFPPGLTAAAVGAAAAAAGLALPASPAAMAMMMMAMAINMQSGALLASRARAATAMPPPPSLTGVASVGAVPPHQQLRKCVSAPCSPAQLAAAATTSATSHSASARAVGVMDAPSRRPELRGAGVPSTCAASPPLKEVGPTGESPRFAAMSLASPARERERRSRQPSFLDILDHAVPVDETSESDSSDELAAVSSSKSEAICGCSLTVASTQALAHRVPAAAGVASIMSSLHAADDDGLTAQPSLSLPEAVFGHAAQPFDPDAFLAEPA